MNLSLTPLIHHYDVKGVLGLGQHEHRPFQWPHVSLVTQETLQIRIWFVRQRRDPTLEQTNKHESGIRQKKSRENEASSTQKSEYSFRIDFPVETWKTLTRSVDKIRSSHSTIGRRRVVWAWKFDPRSFDEFFFIVSFFTYIVQGSIDAKLSMAPTPNEISPNSAVNGCPVEQYVKFS